jgi:hypothetical protein
VKWTVSSVSWGPSVSLNFGMFGMEDEHRFREVNSFSGRCSARCNHKHYFYHVAVWVAQTAFILFSTFLDLRTVSAGPDVQTLIYGWL